MCACLFVPVWVSYPPSESRILPHIYKAAAWEGGPQEELQHSCSTHHSLQINN